ncbi:MAG: beta-ketoacyl synthase N-terminal-like domain-containing protein [Thermodesulfobacteriota bacterium]
MHNPVCIVGIGAVTSIGLNAPATAAAARAGIANFNDHPYMIDRYGDPYVLAMVPSLETGIIGAERYVQMALPAMQEALRPLTGFDKSVFQVEAQIGLPEDRPGFPGDLQRILSDEVKKLGSEAYTMSEIAFIVKGHSAGLMALEAGSRKILNHACEFCLVGGVDSYLDPDTLDWIEDNEQLHVPSNAWGFIPGEAAAFCLLCSQNTAEKYRLPVRAQLLAISTAIEENRIKTETVCLGKGLTMSVKNCLQELPADFRIDYTICDQNGEAYRADEFGFMLARLSERFVDPSDYLAPADCWGDVGAASGPLFINSVIAAAEKGYAKGPHTLLWTSSEGGERSAAIIYAEIRERGMS